MMKRFPQRLDLMVLVLIPFLTSGCLGLKPKPDPSRFYVLGDTSSRTTDVDLNCEKRVLVGPVSLAGHLDNPRIARRVQSNEISYSDWSFWAEPLARSFPRQLIFALEESMPGVCFFDFRKTSPRQGDIDLEVSVEQFEMTNEGNVVVAVNWTISTVGEPRKRQGSVRLTKSIEQSDDEILGGILALNLALNEVAIAIAKSAQ